MLAQYICFDSADISTEHGAVYALKYFEFDRKMVTRGFLCEMTRN